MRVWLYEKMFAAPFLLHALPLGHIPVAELLRVLGGMEVMDD